LRTVPAAIGVGVKIGGIATSPRELWPVPTNTGIFENRNGNSKLHSKLCSGKRSRNRWNRVEGGAVVGGPWTGSSSLKATTATRAELEIAMRVTGL
jgi:hypothetical protein